MKHYIALAGAIASPALANAGLTTFDTGRVQTVSQPAPRNPHWTTAASAADPCSLPVSK